MPTTTNPKGWGAIPGPNTTATPLWRLFYPQHFSQPGVAGSTADRFGARKTKVAG